MGYRDPLRPTRGAGRENDPRVVVDCELAREALRLPHAAQAQVAFEHAAHIGTVEDLRGARRRVVGIDGHVRSAGTQHAQNPRVQPPGSAFEVHAHALARAHALLAQGSRDAVCGLRKL
jgi:hypothetical protein